MFIEYRKIRFAVDKESSCREIRFIEVYICIKSTS